LQGISADIPYGFVPKLYYARHAPSPNLVHARRFTSPGHAPLGIRITGTEFPIAGFGSGDRPTEILEFLAMPITE